MEQSHLHLQFRWLLCVRQGADNQVADLTSSTELYFDDILQRLIDLRAHLDGVSKRARSNRCNHELLEGHQIAGVNPAVQDVEKGNGHNIWLVRAKLLTEELV